MASNLPKLLKRGFTFIESVVVLFVFVIGMVLVSRIYFNLVKSNIFSQDLQIAFDNVRFGAEKIWSEIKSGSQFSPTSSSLKFKNRRCQEIEISKRDKNLIFKIENQEFQVFDSNFVELKDFKVYFDDPKNSGVYYERAYKIFVLEYDFDLKTKTTKVPFTFRQTIAPSNSVLINEPCL